MSVRARTFEFAVSMDESWVVHSDRGGDPLPHAEAWTPEHLLLAGLCRCVLTSLRHHAGRAGVTVTSSGSARGTVTRRETDGRFAFVDVEAELHVSLAPRPDAEALRALLAKGERDCFVGASLTASPTYRWIVDGEEIT